MVYLQCIKIHKKFLISITLNILPEILFSDSFRNNFDQQTF